MAYTTINKSTDFFNTILYTGTGSSQSITGVGFQPDWIWYKNRGTTNSHGLQDVIRGFNTTGIQSSNGTDADPAFNGNTLGYVSAVGSDGFTVEAGNCANASGNNYVSWNWKANGTGSSNTDGSITSTVSANTTSGFSIVSWTGTGANATVGHGLSAVPKMVICKNTSSGTPGWSSWHTGIGDGNNYILLNTTQSVLTASNIWNSTTPTSSVISVGPHSSTNGSGSNMIAYCFADVPGYSKFGSYTGNGSTDGPFCYTGFKPAWIMYKTVDSSDNWEIHDNKRDTFNPMDTLLYANGSNAESDPSSTTDRLNILSNGFKIITGSSDYNGSGDSYIYMAFGQSIVGSNNVPATAR